MPEHTSRFAAALYDQFEDEQRVADWGGDELFTRVPRPRAVDDAPAPRFRPYLAASEPAQAGSESAAIVSAASTAPRPAAARRAPERSLTLVEPPEDRRLATVTEEPTPRDRRRAAGTAEQAMIERAERLGLSVVEPAQEPAHSWDESGAILEPPPAGRTTKVITGHPGGAPRPLPTVRTERRRPPRTPAEWIGPRPERIVGWAFALGLLLILIAISTADAATF